MSTHGQRLIVKVVLEEMFMEDKVTQMTDILQVGNSVKTICGNMRLAAETVLNLIKSQIGIT